MSKCCFKRSRHFFCYDSGLTVARHKASLVVGSLAVAVVITAAEVKSCSLLMVPYCRKIYLLADWEIGLKEIEGEHRCCNNVTWVFEHLSM